MVGESSDVTSSVETRPSHFRQSVTTGNGHDRFRAGLGQREVSDLAFGYVCGTATAADEETWRQARFTVMAEWKLAGDHCERQSPSRDGTFTVREVERRTSLLLCQPDSLRARSDVARFMRH